MKKLIKPIGLLLLMILVCSIIARFFNGSDTLSEYADKNPELAYSTPERKEIPSNTPDVLTPSASPISTDKAPPSSFSPVASPSSTLESPLSDQQASDSTLYKEGFFYQPLSVELIARITGTSYPIMEAEATELSVPAVNIMDNTSTPAVAYDDLCYMQVMHYDFNGEVQTGELICNKLIADDIIEIFYELYLNEYQIEKIRLIDEYDGDDTASMEDNNTSCFNYRVVDGTSSLSKHALGCAIDINPFYNPYVVFNKEGSGDTYISPKGSEVYADRSKDFAYKIDENDLCYKLFKQHGFTWGGNWNSMKDYQHFQKVII